MPRHSSAASTTRNAASSASEASPHRSATSTSECSAGLSARTSRTSARQAFSEMSASTSIRSTSFPLRRLTRGVSTVVSFPARGDDDGTQGRRAIRGRRAPGLVAQAPGRFTLSDVGQVRRRAGAASVQDPAHCWPTPGPHDTNNRPETVTDEQSPDAPKTAGQTMRRQTTADVDKCGVDFRYK